MIVVVILVQHTHGFFGPDVFIAQALDVADVTDFSSVLIVLFLFSCGFVFRILLFFCFLVHTELKQSEFTMVQV